MNAISTSETHELTITFPTKEAKEIFAQWLCDGGGEQDYFRSMEESQTPNLRLSYHGPENEAYPHNDERRYGSFLCDNTIRVLVISDE